MKLNKLVPKAKAVEVLEASINVTCQDHRAQIDFRSIAHPDCYLRVNVPIETWREFCRRQLAVPPPLPLPKGGVS